MTTVYVGSVFHESNTFNPVPTRVADFTVFRGDGGLARVAGTAVLREAGADVVGGLWMMALSSGPVEPAAFEQAAGDLEDDLRRSGPHDGVLLHVHGSMMLTDGTSADRALVGRVRRLVGPQVPIVLAMDPHGNIGAELVELVDGICAYKTIPHLDQDGTEKRAARLLLARMRDGRRVAPELVKIPMVIGGDSAIDAMEPLRSIYGRVDAAPEGGDVLEGSFFVGFSWSDSPDLGSAVVMNPTRADTRAGALQEAWKVAELAWSSRRDFEYAEPALGVPEALEWAIAQPGNVALADTGDNTTGGAQGTSTVLVRALLGHEGGFARRACVGPVRDDAVVAQLTERAVGEHVTIALGVDTDEHSPPVELSGTLVAKGGLLGYLGTVSEVVGRTVTVRVGEVDVVVADHPSSFVTLEHFAAAGLAHDGYDVVVVKQGYLFPDIAAQWSSRRFVLTPGATDQLFWRLPFGDGVRGLFPFDQEARLR